MATVRVRRVAATTSTLAAPAFTADDTSSSAGPSNSDPAPAVVAPARHPHDRWVWLVLAVAMELCSGVLNSWLSGWVEHHAHRGGVSIAPLLHRVPRAAPVPIPHSHADGIAVSAASAEAAEGESVHFHFDAHADAAAAAAHDHALPWVDVGIAWLPALHDGGGAWWARMLPDALVLALVGAFVATVVVHGGRAQRVRRVAYFLLLHAATSVLRTCTNTVTIGRPSPVCFRRLSASANGSGSSSSSSSSGAGDDSVGWLFNTNCYDMSISGHTCVSVLIAWAVWHAPPHAASLPFRVLTAVVAGASALAQVMVGDHYSVDVVLAVYVATSAYWLARDRLQSTYGPATPAQVQSHPPPPRLSAADPVPTSPVSAPPPVTPVGFSALTPDQTTRRTN